MCFSEELKLRARAAEWKHYIYHQAPAAEDWPSVIQASRAGAKAKYHPDITRDIQQRLETECLLYAVENCANQCPNGHFWMQCNRIIGVSSGELTSYIYVEWERNPSINEFHGRPALPSYLHDKKGVAQLRGVRP